MIKYRGEQLRHRSPIGIRHECDRRTTGLLRLDRLRSSASVGPERLKLPRLQCQRTSKMPYYTAHNRTELPPLRLMHALRAKPFPAAGDKFGDTVGRDIRFVLTRATDLHPALIATDRSASSTGKHLIEQIAAPIDGRYLDATGVRHATNRQNQSEDYLIFH